MKLPRKFLWRCPLEMGAKVTGIVMIIIMISSCIASVYQLILMRDCSLCGKYVWRNTYAFTITASIYYFLMLAINICLLFAIKKEKPSVVLIWLVMTGFWLLKSIAIVIVLLCMYQSEVSFISWLLSFISTLLAIALFIYLYLVVWAYWIQLKEKASTTDE
ncbi:hypothetical protein evm_011460 [Chilo suppressalis]|nr:hypothetical protein evm_011460 [Chilo suppressalis]